MSPKDIHPKVQHKTEAQQRETADCTRGGCVFLPPPASSVGTILALLLPANGAKGRRRSPALPSSSLHWNSGLADKSGTENRQPAVPLPAGCAAIPPCLSRRRKVLASFFFFVATLITTLVRAATNGPFKSCSLALIAETLSFRKASWFLSVHASG